MPYRLVDKAGNQIGEGAVVKTFRGEEVTLVSIYEPGTRTGGNGGRVQLDGGKLSALYFPGVIGARFIEDLPDTDKREVRGSRSFRENLAREKGYDE
jgi:hypothetical protein